MGEVLTRPEWQLRANERQREWRRTAREMNRCAYTGCYDPPICGQSRCEVHRKAQAVASLASYHARTKPRGDDSELGRMGKTKYCIEDMILELANEYD